MISLILTYKYYLLLPLAVIEGPILTVIAGFLSSMKLLNPVLVYIIVVAGDMIGDSFLYWLGRGGKRFFPGRFRFFFRLSKEKKQKALEYFGWHRVKTLIFSKIVHGIGFTGLVVAGSLRIPYKNFIQTCALVSLVQSAVLLFVGFFFGSAYVTIGRYLNYYAAGTIIIALAVGAYFLIKNFRTSLNKNGLL